MRDSGPMCWSERRWRQGHLKNGVTWSLAGGTFRHLQNGVTVALAVGLRSGKMLADAAQGVGDDGRAASVERLI